MGKFEGFQGSKGITNDLDAAKSQADILEFTLNGMYDTSEGAKGSLHSESGMAKELLSDYLINGTLYRHVGNVDITPNKKVLFLSNDNNKEAIAYFQKGRIELVREFTDPSELMGINTKYPIQGIGRIRRGTDVVVYWNDGHNPDRYIILTKLDSYLTVGGLFNPDLTLFNQKFIPAQVELVRGYDTGGSFELGAYRLGLQYVDTLGNATETFYISNPFFATRGPWTGGDDQIEGGFNVLSDNHSLRSDAYDVVNKSFEFNFTNIDTTYDILRIFTVKYTDGNQTPVAVYKVRDIVINDRTDVTWTFKGIEGNFEVITIESLVASYAKYSTSQAMHHIQNILIKGNLTETPYDWAKFQKYITQSAKVKWVVKDINTTDAGINNRDLDNKHAIGGFQNQSVFRGDVQTVGVSVLLTDGTKSPVFIIPGRPALEAGDTYVVDGQVYDPTTHYNVYPDGGQRNNVPGGASWDRANLLVREDESLEVSGVILGYDVNPDIEVSYSNAAGGNGTIPGESVERYKVYSTVIDDAPADVEAGYIGSGIMGFYEVDTTYPEIRDSDGDVVFPHTIGGGGAIVMDKIRHHQFPDCDLAPIHSQNTSEYASPFVASTALGQHIHPMGIKVFDLIFPPEYVANIAGVQFYYGDRTDDFIIADKGILLSSSDYRRMGNYDPLSELGSYYAGGGGSPSGGFNQNRAQFQSSNIQFDINSYSGASYLRVERTFPTIEVTDAASDITATHNYGRAYRKFLEYGDITDITTTQPHGYRMLQYLNRGIESFNYESWGVTGNYNPDNGLIVGTQKELGINVLPGIPGYNPANPPGLETLVEDAAHWVVGNTVNPPPGEIGHANYYSTYVSLRTTREVFDNLQGIIFQPATGSFVPIDTTYDVQGRDCFISRDYFIGSANRDETGTYDGYRFAYMHSYYSESAINIDLRHSGGDPNENFYPSDPDILTFIDWGGSFYTGDSRVEEFNAHNPDFGVLDNPRAGFLFDLTIDYQSQELGRFPVRIAWSGRSQDEELQDLNLVFSALDYDDLSTDKGEIRMLAQKPNALYAMTDYSVFRKPTNAQQLDLSLSTAFLKQSSFLDIPETELYDTGSGYGGCQHRLAYVHTEFGTMYVNQFKGEVYLLNKDIVPLTDKGLRYRLSDILPSKLLSEFEKVMGYGYPLYDATTNFEGLGVRCYYDPIWRRGIISKIDYEFKYPFGGKYDVMTAIPDVIYWNISTNLFIVNGVSINLHDNTVANRAAIQRKHITLSYSFEEQKWASYHSWIPRCGFNDTTNLYTQPLYSQYMYKHTRHNYLEYYDEGVRFPFILEWNITNLERNFISNINWLTRCGEWSNQYNRYLNKKDETFNSLIMYTDYRTTGELSLINLQDNPFGQFGLSSSEKYIKRYNNTWRVNQLWDLREVSSDVEPSMTEDLLYAPYADTWYQGLTGGYIDKEVNALSFNYNKSLFSIPSIDNQFITTRLKYYNQNINHRLSVDLINLFKQEDLS